MNLNQTFVVGPGTVMLYVCKLYMHSMSLFAHIFDLKKTKQNTVNGEWIVHVGGCLT